MPSSFFSLLFLCFRNNTSHEVNMQKKLGYNLTTRTNLKPNILKSQILTPKKELYFTPKFAAKPP